MRSTRSKPLKRPTETSSYIPTWDIGFSKEHIWNSDSDLVSTAYSCLSGSSFEIFERR
uniref:Uncharacterized protein n=2 Tax=unclassified Caudoviricetes TaxID=2788787 RepID=A0A8S5UJ36_9CAUD|nr:MAG TPA: hypothetical protein [Siphoviridae sp. ctYlL44]DAF94444.1 MAG TPA: hypothetical protein [Siphoviridae sp. ctTL517]